jgi:curved DNA-binding protein CbpA
MGDLYAVLGVERTADARTIRARYRQLARRHHPDLGGDDERMMVLNKAWHVLGNPDRRARYDARARRKATKAQPRSRDGHTVLDFGRYEGQSLGEIAAADDNYLVWLRRTSAGRHLQREIDDLLKARASAAESLRPAPSAGKPGQRWRRAVLSR